MESEHRDRDPALVNVNIWSAWSASSSDLKLAADWKISVTMKLVS